MNKTRIAAGAVSVTAVVLMGLYTVTDTADGPTSSRISADSGHESKFPTPTAPPPAAVSMAVTTTTAAAAQ